MNATVNEIAPDLFRITCFVERANFQFSSFLVRDEEPLLYHTNLRGLFPEIKAGVESVLDPQQSVGLGSVTLSLDDKCGA